MKTKLTLTVEKRIIEKAKLKAASRGISLSKMFEEIFEKENPELEKTSEQKAAARLLQRLEEIKSTKAPEKNDKDALKDYLREKYG